MKVVFGTEAKGIHTEVRIKFLGNGDKQKAYFRTS